MKLFASLSLSFFLMSCAQSPKNTPEKTPLIESQFEIYNPGFAAGTLKITKASSIESGDFLPDETDVLVLDRMPKFNNLVRAVIVSKPAGDTSTSLIRSKALSIPFVYISGASKSAQFKDLDGKKVFFKPQEGATAFSLMPLNEKAYEKFDSVLKSKFSKVDIELDEKEVKNERSFFDLNSKAASDQSSVCGPVPNNIESVNGFCIPFYYFDTFMRMNKRGSENLREYALSQLQESEESKDSNAVKNTTKRIQQAFMDAKMSDRHVDEIRNKFLETFDPKTSSKKEFIFRGSSNVDNVSRLYLISDQEVIRLSYKSVKKMNNRKLEEMIKKIWSSLYSYQNYSARKQFEVDESKAYISILAYENGANGEDVSAPVNTANFGLPTPRFENPILMIDSDIVLSSELAEVEYGPIGQTTRARYQFAVPTGISFSEFKESFSEVKIKMSDFLKLDQDLKVKNVNVVSEGSWLKDAKNKGVETKDYRIFFETDHPYFKDLNMAINYKAVRKNGVLTNDNIVTIDKARIERLVNKKHYLYRDWNNLKNSGTDENKRYVVADLSLDPLKDSFSLKDDKIYCYKANKIAVLSEEDKDSKIIKIKLTKGVEPFNLEKDLIIEQEFRVESSESEPGSDSKGFSQQHSVFLGDAKLPGSEEAKFLVFTEYSENKKSKMSVFNTDLKRINRFTLGQDCLEAK